MLRWFPIAAVRLRFRNLEFEELRLRLILDNAMDVGLAFTMFNLFLSKFA